jgi:hypothetical protein
VKISCESGAAVQTSDPAPKKAVDAEGAAPGGVAQAPAKSDVFVGPLGEALAELSAGSEERHFVERQPSGASGLRGVWESGAPLAAAPVESGPPAEEPAAMPRPHLETSGDAEPRGEAITNGEPGESRVRAATGARKPLPMVALDRPAPAPTSMLSVAASLGAWITASVAEQSSPAAVGGSALAVTTPAAAAGNDAALPVPPWPEGATIRVLAQGAATQAASVEIRHPELGAIQIDVRLEQGSLEVRAVTASTAAAMTLRASESALRDSIALAGIELRSLHVDRREDDPNAARRERKPARRRPIDTEA